MAISKDKKMLQLSVPKKVLEVYDGMCKASGLRRSEMFIVILSSFTHQVSSKIRENSKTKKIKKGEC